MSTLKNAVKRIVRKVAPFAFLDPQGEKGIAKRGHRGYVGGMWEEIGKLQFDFLKSQGLSPNSYLLDVACGSLRLGVHAIPYLDQFHYLGIEKESELVKAGLEKELGTRIDARKQPNIIISDSFEFSKLKTKANFAIAQSLFTHLPPKLINLCFHKLYPCLQNDGVFYATFNKTDHDISNPDQPHDHALFWYTREQMINFGNENNFIANFIGDWGHPRGQVMMEYTKKDMP